MFNAFHLKLTMIEGKHDFHEQKILLDLLHNFDMQHTSWNIADNLALKMLLFFCVLDMTIVFVF